MNNNTSTLLPIRSLFNSIIFLALFCGISPLLYGQFTGGVAVTDQSLLNKTWHISNKASNKLLVPDNGQLRHNYNSLNETSTWIIEDMPDDGKWWTADKKWFAIRNAATGLYLTIQNTFTPNVGRHVGFEELGPTNNPGLLTRQQFEVVLIAGNYYKIRSRVEGSTTWGKLILKCDDDGVTYAVENNLLGDRVSFAFNLALPSDPNVVYSLIGINNSHFISDQGKSSNNSPVVHLEDHDHSALWSFIQSGDEDYYFIRNALTGNYLSNNGNNGDYAKLYTNTSPGESTKWQLVRAGTNVRIKSKGGGNIIPQFIGIGGTPGDGKSLYGVKSNVIGIEWIMARSENEEPEPEVGDFDRIPVETETCPVVYGESFKKALAERAGLPAHESYFTFIIKAFEHYYGNPVQANRALTNFDLNNIGHRAELIHAVKYYVLNDIALRSQLTWTPEEIQAMAYFKQEVQNIRITYANRLATAWSEFIAAQNENLINSGFTALLQTATNTNFDWPSDYDMSVDHINNMYYIASASKTFNLNNRQLNFNYANGATFVASPFIGVLINRIILNSATASVHAAISGGNLTPPAVELWKKSLLKTSNTLSSAIFGAGKSVQFALVANIIGTAGTVITVVSTAAQVLAAQIIAGLDFQRLQNKKDMRITLSQLPVNIPAVMLSDDELAKLKMVNDFDYILAYKGASDFVFNNNDNITFEPFTISCKTVNISLDANCTAQVQLDDIFGNSIVSCGGLLSVNISKTIFTSNDLGQNHVEVTASNNIATKSCTATVIVQDNTPPTVTCKDAEINISPVLGFVSIPESMVHQSSSDNCGTVSLSVSPAIFFCSNVGNNLVTLTAKDGNNNTSTCTANVTVRDITPPTAKCKSNIVQLDANGNGSLTAEQMDNGSSDICGIQSRTLSQSMFDCSDVGIIPVTLTVTDNHDNTSQCTANVQVVDNVPPVAICQSVTVYLDANGQGSLTAEQMDNGSSDACGIQSMTLSDIEFDCSHVGPNHVTMTVKDNNNKSSQCSANVEVLDNVPPVALCQTVIVQLDANGQGSLTAAQMDAGSNDACDIQSLTLNRYAFDCSDLGAVPMTLTVEDQNNNVSTCNASVIVQDNILPQITCPANIVVSNDPGDCSAVVDFTVAASDNCSFSVAKLAGYNTGQPFPVGVTTNQFQVTDAAQNQASCSFTVTVNKFGDPDLLYAYTVIGLNGIDLKQNTLLAGGIGVVNVNKKVKLESGTVINSTNTFVKTPILDLNSGSLAQVHHQGQVDANLLPVFIPNDNPLNTNLDIADNSAPVNLDLGSYGKITIGKNVTATFTGNATVFVKELKLKEGAKLLFGQNTSVHIDKKMDLDKNAVLDKGSHTVWIFVEDDVKIDEGSTVFANIYSQKQMKVEKATVAKPTKLTGLFIADKVDAKEFVIWDWDVAQCPFTPNTSNLVFNGSINLTAAHVETAAKLTCVTNLGLKARKVMIERSADGFNFEPLFEMSEVEMVKTVSIGRYLDENPLPGLNFYRATAEMEDGTNTFSPVRMLEYSLTEHLNLFPNPANNHIRVYCEKRVGKPASIFMFNSQGLQVFRQDFDALPGHILSFEVDNFREGLYLLTLRSEGGRDLTKQFVIAK